MVILIVPLDSLAMSSAHSLVDLASGCAGGIQSDSLRSTSLSAARAGMAAPAARPSVSKRGAARNRRKAMRRPRIGPRPVNFGMSPPRYHHSYGLPDHLAGAGASRQARRPVSGPSVPRVPVALEIGDQRRREVAIGLLARVNGGVAPKRIERLLADPDGAAVADGADGPSAGEPVDDAVDRGVHFGWWRDLVADQPAFGAVAIEAALVEDGLPRDAVADEARQAQIREAGNDSLLARGQGEIGVRSGEQIVHAQDRLAVAADGERVDGADPELFCSPAVDVVGDAVG